MAAVQLAAITPRSPEPALDVLVLIDPQQQSDLDFKPVFAEAAQYKLSALGLVTKVATASRSDAEAPLVKAQASGAPAALVCRYLVQGQQMELTLVWYDAKARASVVVVSAEGEVNLHLDGVILAALDQVLEKVQASIAELQALRTRAQAAQQGSPAGLTTTSAATLPSPAPPSGTAILAPGAPSRPAAGRRVLLAGGFAPFVPTGAASYYFALGYLPSLLATVFLDTPLGPVGIGAYAGVDYFSATGTLDSSTNFLVPIGLDVRYELNGGALRPFFHVAGGPALLFMVTGGRGTLMDVLPFLKSGVGLGFGLGGGLGLSILADYDVYFEMPYLLTGFSPSVNMEVRL